MSPRSSDELLGHAMNATPPPSAVAADSESASSEPSSPAPAQVEDAGMASAETKTQAVPAKRSALKRNGQPRKKKIRTYSRRKAEMAELQVELEGLEEKRKRVSERAESVNKQRALVDTEEYNKLLRETIHKQRLLLATSTSLVSSFLRSQDFSPFESFIRLGRDPQERRATMLALKPEKIQSALQFLQESRRFIDPTADFTETKRFRSRGGDLCCIRFSITPFPEVPTVMQAFKTLQQFIHNMEISVSEVMGDITVRENDDDNFDDSMTHHKLVTSVANVVFLDANNITFAELLPGSTPDDDIGVIVAEYVDEDELYPYRPTERVRQDITIRSMVASYLQPDGQRIVALTRWSMFRFHHSPFLPFDANVADRVTNGSASVDEAMINAIRHSVGI